MRNLITLCAQCHMDGIHRGNLRIEVLSVSENDVVVRFVRVDGWRPQ